MNTIKSSEEVRNRFKAWFKRMTGGDNDFPNDDDIADFFLLDRQSLLEGLKKEVERLKFTFKKVDWGDGIITDEPVEDETKCLEYAKGFNSALDKVLAIIESKK